MMWFAKQIVMFLTIGYDAKTESQRKVENTKYNARTCATRKRDYGNRHKSLNRVKYVLNRYNTSIPRVSGKGATLYAKHGLVIFLNNDHC